MADESVYIASASFADKKPKVREYPWYCADPPPIEMIVVQRNGWIEAAGIDKQEVMACVQKWIDA